MSVPVIHSPRIDLVSMSPGVLEALLDGRREQARALLGTRIADGWPDRHDHGFLRMRLGQMREDASTQRWLVRAMVRRRGRAMIGFAGYHGPPGVNGPGLGDAVEIGYRVFPPYRGRGYATEVAQALVAWAGEQGVARVVASIGPDNTPSLAIARRLGFVQTGEQWDEEDGLELVFERPTA